MTDEIRLEDVFDPSREADVVQQCPNCDGDVALFLEESGEDGLEQCTIVAAVHREPTAGGSDVLSREGEQGR